ncbi:hypothetical protein [Iodidimonas sp. SYSU 1G8]|uniref:hypothetical protein n=1 Tax=Iodidimonas sp. SYSU 1G8 TaxID=3133967 RepID=UPI0031FEFC70
MHRYMLIFVAGMMLASVAAAQTRADVDAAVKCRGLVSAAAATHRIQPDAAKAAGLPLPPSGLDIRYLMEIDRRAKAAKLPESEVNTLLASGVARVLANADAMKAAAPDVQRCIDEAPKRQ